MRGKRTRKKEKGSKQRAEIKTKTRREQSKAQAVRGRQHARGGGGGGAKNEELELIHNNIQIIQSCSVNASAKYGSTAHAPSKNKFGAKLCDMV